jgi:hypothetical protein
MAMRLPVVPSDVLDAALSWRGAGGRRDGRAGAAEAGGADEAGKAGVGDGVGDSGLGLGEHVLRTALTAWDVPETRAAFLGLLRTAVTSEKAAATLREFATQAILGRIAQAAGHATGDGDGEYRAALAASQVLGLALARYVLQFGPIAQASNEELAAAIGPTLDRYLTGNVRPGQVRAQKARPEGTHPDHARPEGASAAPFDEDAGS